MAQNDPTTPPTPPNELAAQGEADGALEQLGDGWFPVIDAALKVQEPIARRYVARLRAKHSGATERQLMEKLSRRFMVLTTATGAGIGGVAALPGLGTATALGLTVGEGVTFAEACAFLTLAAAELHGVDMRERSTRRLVLMSILSGERGTEIIGKTMGKQGLQWNTVLSGGGGFLPGLISKQVSRYVRRRVATRTSLLWIARLLPFGIGAAIGGFGARTVGKSVVEAMHEIFGQAETLDGELGGEDAARA